MNKLLFPLVLLLSFQISQTNGQQIFRDSLEHDGKMRYYNLYVPSGFDETKNWPLVFNLHGFGSNAIEQQAYTRMELIAEEEKFLVCFPDGLANSWNVGWVFGSMEDDVGLISNLIDRISDSHHIDLERVYSCGMSNGGFMSYRLACELSDRIAAIASVTGAISPALEPECAPGRAVPTMQIHGTADDVVLYDGLFGVNIPIEDVIDLWIDKNNCSTTSDTIHFEDVVSNDQSTAIKIRYNDCEDGTKVHFIKVENGGHTWPGSSINIGITNQDFSASQEIWNFFSQFSLNTTTSVGDIDTEIAIRIFPNPTPDYLNFNYPNGVENIKIYDTNGLILKSFPSLPSNQISVSDLEPGLYILNFNQGNSILSTKFIKL